MTPQVEDSPKADPILVTGATGTLGKPVVEKLAGLGLNVRALSRRPQSSSTEGVTWWVGDLKRAEGLDHALTGVRRVVHCASSQKGDAEAARNLLDSMGRCGVRDLVYISIVGVDRVHFGYYRSKLETEEIIGTSDLRSTILRTTQFHDLIERVCRAITRSPVIFVPSGTGFQPIDVNEVADRLVELTTGQPGAGRVDDMGGPEVRSCEELVRTFLTSRGKRRLVVPLRFPGAVFAGFRAGFNCAPDRAVGRRTFDEFLEGRLAS